jgi:hypothetical protein
LAVGAVGALLASALAVLLSVGGVDWAARSVLRPACSETLWSGALSAALGHGVSAWEPLVVLGALLAAVFLGPPARVVWRWLRAVSLREGAATESARWRRGAVWGGCGVVVVAALGVATAALGGGVEWRCDLGLLAGAVMVMGLTLSVLGVWWPAGALWPVRLAYLGGAIFAVAIALAVYVSVAAAGGLLVAGWVPSFWQCQVYEGQTLEQVMPNAFRRGDSGMDPATWVLMLLLLRPVLVGARGLLAGRRGAAAPPATTADSALRRWSRRDPLGGV